MIGRDLLFRGRGADVGVRAPDWLIRLCGAALALAIVWLGDALGVWALIGLPRWALSVMAVAGGALVAPSRLGGLLWLVAGTLATVLMLVMFTPVVRPMVSPFVRADQPGPEPVDALIVLSGGITSDGHLTGQALDRLLSAMHLARQRAIGDLALSVVAAEGLSYTVTSEADQRALVALAMPPVALRFVHDVHSTHDEALAFAALGRTHGWHRVVVVTSPMHSRRACETIEATGLVVECHPAAGRDYAMRRLATTEDRRLAFRDVVRESAATLMYRARGRM